MRARRPVRSLQRITAWGSHNIAKKLGSVPGSGSLHTEGTRAAADAMEAMKGVLYDARR